MSHETVSHGYHEHQQVLDLIIREATEGIGAGMPASRSQSAQQMEWRGAPQSLGGTELLYPFNKGGQAFSSVEGPGGSMDEGSCMQGSRGPRAIGNCPSLAAHCPDHLLCAWSAAPCCMALVGLRNCPSALIGSRMPLSLQGKHHNASSRKFLPSCSLRQAEMNSRQLEIDRSPCRKQAVAEQVSRSSCRRPKDSPVRCLFNVQVHASSA